MSYHIFRYHTFPYLAIRAMHVHPPHYQAGVNRVLAFRLSSFRFAQSTLRGIAFLFSRHGRAILYSVYLLGSRSGSVPFGLCRR